ncbi:MAG TPA: IgGFc-binding protein [Polyangia bacterium]|nr:IgGFc-binding protein [Polyangia bacterium]
MSAFAVAGCARVGGSKPPLPPVSDGQADGQGDGGPAEKAGDEPKPTAETREAPPLVDGCALAISNGSTEGCDFYAVPPPPMGTGNDGSCFVAMVANTWTSPVTLQVEYGGQPLDVTQIARSPGPSGATLKYDPLPGGQLAPGQMAIIFLAGGSVDPRKPVAEEHIDCPIPAGIKTDFAGFKTDPAIDGTGIGLAFHIRTSAPVAAYDIYPYGGAASHISSATLLIPTSAWGTNYIAAVGYKDDQQLGSQHAVQIVATQDGTQVTVNPTVAIVGSASVPATGRRQPHTYALSTGQVLQFMQPAGLTGSAINSTKPVGVWGGSDCMNIPVGMGACDSAHQQLVPVGLLGFEYAAVRYRDRVTGNHESVPWTLVGAVDGTTLTYDPAPPAGAPASVNRGQSFEFSAADAFTVRSTDQQHPFYLAGHMTGRQVVSSDDARNGDPETVNTVPPQQWLKSYVFLTDPTYSDTNLVFVRQKSGQTFGDVTLDCVGTLTNWKPIGGAGTYESTTVDLVTAFKPQGNCNNGVHTAKSSAPFGLTVWGWDFAVSYAYPAGMGVRKINDVVVP